MSQRDRKPSNETLQAARSIAAIAYEAGHSVELNLDNPSGFVQVSFWLPPLGFRPEIAQNFGEGKFTLRYGGGCWRGAVQHVWGKGWESYAYLPTDVMRTVLARMA